jgi:flagellar biosynthetic protein FlhB
MADDDAEKTEEPSGKKLDEARRAGNVAKSQDLSTWSALAGTTGVLMLAGGWMAQNLAGKLVVFLEQPDAIDLHGGGAVGVMRAAISAALPIMAVVLSVGALSGVFGNLIQTGFLWSTERLKPDLSKLSPLKGLERLFGIDGLIQFFKSIIKVAITATVAWLTLKPHAMQLQDLMRMQPAQILPFVFAIFKSLTLAILVLLGVGGVLDWFLQRMRFMQRMRMSREELKEEVRQSEGDPHVKARQRQLRFDRARRRMMQKVPKATVVITNPTHYAVALHYQQGDSEAPVCVAKGLDRIALKIREIAFDHNVPIVEDPPLARALYAAVELDEQIPVNHYEAVAKIIGFILNGRQRRAAQAARP